MPRAHEGFVALVAVMLAALTIVAFSLVTLDAAAVYSDAADRRELRIQAGLNASACLDTATVMLAKDHYLNGTTTIPEFGCTVLIGNSGNGAGNISLNATAALEGVTRREARVIDMDTPELTVVSDTVE